jgi:hypothetical protein
MKSIYEIIVEAREEARRQISKEKTELLETFGSFFSKYFTKGETTEKLYNIIRDKFIEHVSKNIFSDFQILKIAVKLEDIAVKPFDSKDLLFFERYRLSNYEAVFDDGTLIDLKNAFDVALHRDFIIPIAKANDIKLITTGVDITEGELGLRIELQ